MKAVRPASSYAGGHASRRHPQLAMCLLPSGLDDFRSHSTIYSAMATSIQQHQDPAFHSPGTLRRDQDKWPWKERWLSGSKVMDDNHRAAEDVIVLCQDGRLAEAVKALSIMQEQGHTASKDTYQCLLQKCSNMKALAEAKELHGLIAKSAHKSNSFLGNGIVHMYVRCGSLPDAVEVFNQLSKRTLISWTALISGYTSAGQGQEALRLYDQMQEQGVRPDKFTIVSILKACGSVNDLRRGKEVNAEAVRSGFVSDLFVGSALVDMYARCRSMVDAQRVFDDLAHKDVVTWNAMIGGYAQQELGEKAFQLYTRMAEEGVRPSRRTFPSVLKACGYLAGAENETYVDGQRFKLDTLSKVRDVHSEAMRWGCDSDVFVGNSLVDAYAKCGSMDDATRVFQRLSKSNIVSWNALAAGYARQEDGEKVMQLYAEMRVEGVRPDKWTFVSLLKACASLAVLEDETLSEGQNLKLQSLQMGEDIHTNIIKSGCQSDVFVGNALVHMYVKCGDLVRARSLFESLSQRDVVSWTAMLGGYVQEEQAVTALQLYSEMLEEGFKPNNWTFVSALRSCGILGMSEEETLVGAQFLKVESLRRGQTIHNDVIRSCLKLDAFLGSALVDMYAKCGNLVVAREVFDSLPELDVVCWNTMISGYAQSEQADQALQVYGEMQRAGMGPNESTFTSLLRACSNLGALKMCVEIHQDILQSGVEYSPMLSTSLIHVYGRCGSMVDAEEVFDSLLQHTVAAWNALIAGYARQGDYNTSLLCFATMQQSGLRPDALTLLYVLAACNHGGMVQEGIHYFEYMTNHFAINPRLEHFTTLVDLLGRAGRLDMVRDLLLRMPMQPVLPMWLSLLVASRNYRDVEMGRLAFDGAVSLQPRHSSAYLLMASIYRQEEMWEEGNMINQLRVQAGAWKKPGESWIEHQGKLHKFVAGDTDHMQAETTDADLIDLCKDIERILQSSPELRT